MDGRSTHRSRMRLERRRAARKSERNNPEIEVKKILGSLFLIFYITIFILFSLLLAITKGFNEPVGQLFHFFTTGTIDTANKTFSWGNWWFVAGFVVLNFWIAVLIGLFIRFVLQKKADILFEKFEALFKQRPIKFIYNLTAIVVVEEIFFRWVPLGVLYPLWGTDTALWTLIIGSSLLFGFLHINNQEPGQKNFLFTLPQIMGGFVLSYLFLAFGFEAAVVTHFLFNLIIFVFIKIIYDTMGRGALQK